MITRFTIRNFKRLQDVTLELGRTAVFIGPNNAGKTTALQALALWDVGWRRWAEKRDNSKAKDRTGVTINRRDLFAIPVPSAKLLWADLHTHEIARSDGQPKTKHVYINLAAEGDLAISRSLAMRLEHPARALLSDSVPVFYLDSNQPSQARDHFYGLREAKNDLVGFALLDRLARLHRVRRGHRDGRRRARPGADGRRRTPRGFAGCRIETESPEKDVEALDIALPRLSRRFNRQFGHLGELDGASLPRVDLALVAPTSTEEPHDIVFQTMLDRQSHHRVQIGGQVAVDARSVIAFFARQLAKDFQLGSEYDTLHRAVKAFVRTRLFVGEPVDLDDPRVARSLAAASAAKAISDTFRAALNRLTIAYTGSGVAIDGHIRLRDVRPFRTEPRAHLIPRRSLFNRIVGEPHAGGFELAFAGFLDRVPGVQAFAKNYLAVGFQLDLVKTHGELSNYIPDFLVKADDGSITIVETKGREELDLPRKMARLAQWCAGATGASAAIGGPAYGFLYVDQTGSSATRRAASRNF